MLSLINIEDLPEWSTALAGTEWFIISVPDSSDPTGYKSYKMNKSVLNVISQNIANTNLSSDANSRTYSLNGATSSNKLVIQDSSADEVMAVKGDKAVAIDDGHLGVGTADVGTGHTTKRTSFVGGTCTKTVNVESNADNSYGLYVENTATGESSTIGMFVKNDNNETSVTKTGIKVDVQRGASNTAIHIANGDVKLPTGNTGFTGTGSYTTFTIEKGIITSAS